MVDLVIRLAAGDFCKDSSFAAFELPVDGLLAALDAMSLVASRDVCLVDIHLFTVGSLALLLVVLGDSGPVHVSRLIATRRDFRD